MKSIWEGHSSIASILLEGGASPNQQDFDGETALMDAAERGMTQVVKILINTGADVNLIDNGGRRALDYTNGNSSSMCYQAITDLILAAGGICGDAFADCPLTCWEQPHLMN